MRQYVDFLSEQPPFDALDTEDLQRLARHVEVEYAPAGTVVIHAGEPVLDHIFVIRKGTVEVVDRERVIDQLGPGDIFGHISVLSGLPPPLAIHAGEDTLLYRIPDPRRLVKDPELLRFHHYGSLAARTRVLQDSSLDRAQRPVQAYIRSPLWADPGCTVQDAARLITDAGQSCALIPTADGVGIVTDSDIRRGIGDGFPPDTAAAEIAASPALTVPADTTRAQAFLTMVESGVHHLVVSGASGRPVGVVRAIDLASADVRDPLMVRGAIESATSITQLAKSAALLPSTAIELADAGLPGERVGRLLTAVRDALLRKVIELSTTEDLPWSWLVLGSTARYEPLPGSDMDTALAWPTPQPWDDGPAPEGHYRDVAEQVLEAMEQCGLLRCPDGANATNPLFSRSLDRWEAAAVRRYLNPQEDGALLLTAMTTDSRPITDVTVGRQVAERLRKHQPNRTFLNLMLRYTLSVKPPAGFVRDFVVDQSGEHRGQLSLKQGGLLPITSIGRWVAVVTGDATGSTYDRLKRGQDAGLLTSDEAESLMGAFEVCYELLLRRQVDAIRNEQVPSNHVDPRDLDRLTRRHLRAVFQEVSRVQNRLDSDGMSRLP